MPRYVDVSDDGAFGRFGVLAVFSDVGEDAQCAEDGVGGGRGFVDVFEDAFGDATKIAATAWR